MDAALRTARRGARSPESRLPSPGAPLLSPCRHQRAGPAPGSPPPALLLLLLPFLLRRATPGAVATPETTIDGRALSESSLREAESRAFTCLAAAPNLTWYLNGQRQEADSSESGRLLAAAGDGDGNGAALEAGDKGSGSSTFVVTARRLDRRLDCAATDPATGRVSTASVLLNVQFQPEIVRVDAHYREAREPGLLLVLLVLVQANPPADVTWVDQDGQVTVNASSFLLLDAQAYPWLANHTVRVQLQGPPRNASLRASNGLGIASSSVPPPGLLATQLELPLLALVGAAAVALVILLSFGVLISWTVSQKAKRLAGHDPSAQLPLSTALQPKEARLPRANRSLPSNLRLNEFVPGPKGRANDAPAEEGGVAFLEPGNHQALAEQGFGRFLTVGYIYRAPSTSSDEIWL